MKNQKAVVQELDSKADIAPRCQWCSPIQGKEVRRAGRRAGGREGRKEHGNTFQNPCIFSATTPHLNSHPVREQTVLSEDAGMLPGQECWAIKLRFNPSYQRLDAAFNTITYDSWEPGWDQLKSQLHWTPSGPQGSLTSSTQTPPPLNNPAPHHCKETHHSRVQLFGMYLHFKESNYPF